MNSATGAGGEVPPGPDTGHGPDAARGSVRHLHDVLAAAGLDLTAGELADALWLALTAGPPQRPGDTRAAQLARPGPPAPGDEPHTTPVPPKQVEPEPTPPDPAQTPAPAAPEPVSAPQPVTPAPAYAPVYALGDTRPGTGAAAVRVPGVAGLPNPLALTRALRPLKRRVSSLHRFELDETATAEAIADTGGPDVVLRPERARWLDLVLAVDDSLGLRLWQDTLVELIRVLQTSGIFRTVRRVAFTTPVNSAVVDGDRTAVLAVTDGVGPAWRSGAAHRTLAAWARKAPTAVLQPLPLRLWSGTALPAERLRVRTNRPAPANPALRAYDPWLPPHLAAPLQLPVPVLELGDWSLGPWAALIASHGGSATLHVVDAAAPPVHTAQPPPPGAESGPAATKRLLAFQETVSPEAYELAAHLASVDPLTLPVMRVVQAAALPGSSPSCLAEVLLSGLMRLDEPLAGFDVFTFDPEVRHLLRMVVPATSARRTIDAVTDFITPRLGRSLDFPAVIASRTGTLPLPRGGSPFAEVALAAPGTAPGPDAVGPPHPAKEYVVGVHTPGGEVTTGYLVADGLVLTADMGDPAHNELRTSVVEFADSSRANATLVSESGDALLYRLVGPTADRPRVAPLSWGHVAAEDASYAVTVAIMATYTESVLPVPPQTSPRIERTTVRAESTELTISHGDAPPTPVRHITHYLGPLGVSVLGCGAAIFDGDTLCGLVTLTRDPTDSYDRAIDLVVTPVTSFALAPGFYDAIGTPEIDWFRPGELLPDPDPAPAPRPEAAPGGVPAPPAAPPLGTFPPLAPRPAAPAPGGRPQPAAWEPEEIRAQLMELLLWLREEVSFDILETLWPPELLARTLGSLHSGGTARVNWTRRYVSLTSVSWNPVGNSDPGGRALAERALLAAYEEEESVSPRRGTVDEDRLAAHVLKLADRIRPEDDNADDARLYSRAGRHLLRTDDAPTGVGLCERALSYVELRHPPDFPVVGLLAVDSRAALADATVPESGLRAFLALSPETVAAYRPPGVTDGERMVRIHRELTQAEPLRRALDSEALPVYQRALAWCTSNLGRGHLLTEHLLDVVTTLGRRGRPSTS